MILDIIGIAIIVACIIIGMKKGLVKGVFSSLSFILALILTVSTLSFAADFIKETEFGKNIMEKTEIVILESNEEDGKTSIFSELIDTEGIQKEAEKMQENLSEKLGDLVIRSLCAIVLFVAYIILIKIATYILDAVAKLPVLNTFNKIGGIITGAVNAYIFMTILSCILMLLLSTSLGGTIQEQLESSKITAWFYNNNPIL